MKWSKKLTAALLAGCMAVSCIPAAFAWEDQGWGNEDVLIGIHEVDSEGTASDVKVEYNSYGDRISALNQDGAGKKYQLTYDKFGNLTEKKTTSFKDVEDETGVVSEWLKYIYEGRQQSIMQKLDLETGEKSSETRYVYNEDGSLKEERYYDADGNLTSTLYILEDTENRFAAEQKSKEGEVIFSMELLFNDNGDIVSTTAYIKNEEGVEKRYEGEAHYIEDENGRVMSCIEKSVFSVKSSEPVEEPENPDGEPTDPTEPENPNPDDDIVAELSDEEEAPEETPEETTENVVTEIYRWDYEYENDVRVGEFGYILETEDSEKGQPYQYYRYDKNGNMIESYYAFTEEGKPDSSKKYTKYTYAPLKEVLAKDINTSFNDLTQDYYKLPILWGYNMGISVGNGDGTFTPDANCTREQIVSFLWRAVGEPAPSIKVSDTKFTDIPDNYAHDAILWAFENGITAGKSETKFDPKGTCTRAEAVSFIWRLFGKPEPESTTCAFTDIGLDKNPLPYYAKPAMWGAENNIVAGITTTQFGPNKNCTRGQIVCYLYRALS